MHKFVTNDAVLESMINDKSEKLEESNGYDKVRVLGIPWCTKTDTISIELQGIVKCTIEVPTKRHVLSTIAQIFDPLGLVTPVIFSCKNYIAGSMETECKLGRAISPGYWDALEIVVR